MAPPALFAFVQFEFGFLLGPGDGRFLIRPAPGKDPTRVLVLTTLGATERRRRRNRRGRTVEEGGPAPVPTTRATLIRPQAFEAEGAAGRWLDGLRSDEDRAQAELREAVRLLDRALHAHRVAQADPYARDVSARQALVVRIGFGDGEAVADGRYVEAWELPAEGRRTSRSMEAPQERFAALLGARDHVLACEELVLRARADLDAQRLRQAALQARVSLECVLAELEGEIPPDRRLALEEDRVAVGDAANAALRGDLNEGLAGALAEAIGRMEAVLRSRRLSSSS
ncbi:MAG: hypothetical protein M3356_00525 [Actinomycetota bacterium]|nr:hypothetical protein [Actinomycetota bacterium]